MPIPPRSFGPTCSSGIPVSMTTASISSSSAIRFSDDLARSASCSASLRLALDSVAEIVRS